MAAGGRSPSRLRETAPCQVAQDAKRTERIQAKDEEDAEVNKEDNLKGVEPRGRRTARHGEAVLPRLIEDLAGDQRVQSLEDEGPKGDQANDEEGMEAGGWAA